MRRSSSRAASAGAPSNAITHKKERTPMHETRTPDVRLRALAAVGAIVISALAAPAHAQSHDGPGAYGALTGDLLYSNDSDAFQEERANLGYLFSNGWGLGSSVTHYIAPDW